MYIAISGNIGSGKTSLTEMLSVDLGWKSFYENIDNPYLDDFYHDMNRWSFNLQVCFLCKKVEQIKNILDSKKNTIQDRTIFEEGHVFVANLHNMGLMSKRDYDTYMNLFNLCVSKTKQPDLVIYLKSSVSTLISQIQKRGRAFEMNIEYEYLEQLNILYDNWIKKEYKGAVLIIDVDDNDFVLHTDVYKEIKDKILTEIKKIEKEMFPY